MMDDEFVNTFGGTASFYHAIALRQSNFPLFLNRNFRHRKMRVIPDKFVFKLNEITASKPGVLYLFFVSADSHSLDLFVHSYKSFPCSGNHEAVSHSFDFALQQSRNSRFYFVIVFRPGVLVDSLESTPNEKMVLNQCLKSYGLISKKLDEPKLQIESVILEMMSKQTNGSSSHSEEQFRVNMVAPLNRARSFFFPIRWGKATNLFLLKEHSGEIRKSRSESHVSVEIQFKKSQNKLQLPPSRKFSGFGIFYHYIYQKNHEDGKFVKSVVEFRKSIDCPWCDFVSHYSKFCVKKSHGTLHPSSLKALSSLAAHLRCSHFHGKYEIVLDQIGHIHVIIQREYAPNLSLDSPVKDQQRPFSLWRSGRKELTQFQPPQLNIIAQTHIFGSNSSSVTPIPTARSRPSVERQYYHARLGLPLVDDELVWNSDDEVDSSWELSRAHRALEEFEDVSSEEKAFMKLWNTHVNAFPLYGDAHVPLLCERFVTRFSREIFEKKLRYNLVLHLITAWDFSLLRSEDVLHCMNIVDKFISSQIST